MGCSPSLPESEQAPILPQPVFSRQSLVQSPVQGSRAEPGLHLGTPQTGRGSWNCLTHLGLRRPEAAARPAKPGARPSPGLCPGPGLSGVPSCPVDLQWGTVRGEDCLPPVRSSLADAAGRCGYVGVNTVPSLPSRLCPLHLFVFPFRYLFLL